MTTVQTTEVEYKQDELKVSDSTSSKVNLSVQTAKSPGVDSIQPKVWAKIPKTIQEVFVHNCKYRFLANGSVTFYPSPFLKETDNGKKVLPKEKLCNSSQMREFLSKLNCDSIESMYDWNAEIVRKPDSTHCFLRACEISFFQHYPLRISPSDIWLLIVHGIAAHVSNHAESLREKYVSHKGKKELIVDRPLFVKGSKANEWEPVIAEFVQQIDKHTVSETTKLLECDFSSSSLLDIIASKVSIMDICKHYFTYTMRCGCGFPQITLDGTKSDWLQLKNKIMKILKTKVMPEFGEKWSKSLLPMIDRFIAVYDGVIDCVFWNSMIQRCVIRPSYGVAAAWNAVNNNETFYSGWINILFPYAGSGKAHMRWGSGDSENTGSKDLAQNSSCEAYDMSAEYVVAGFNLGSYADMKIGQLPCGLASAPVIYKDYSTSTVYQLKFAAGFVGVDQNEETLEISSKIGWVIAE